VEVRLIEELYFFSKISTLCLNFETLITLIDYTVYTYLEQNKILSYYSKEKYAHALRFIQSTLGGCIFFHGESAHAVFFWVGFLVWINKYS